MIRKSFKSIKAAKQLKRNRRKLSIRKKIVGTTDRPRVCAYKSNKHIQVQVIDDSVGKTLFTVQTFGKSSVGKGANRESATQVGQEVAAQLIKKDIKNVVFDRNGNLFTGVVAKIADSIRENGIRV